MEIIGKFLKSLPEQSGQSQRGEWVRGGFVIETEEQFPKQVAFSLWGEDKVAIVRSMPSGTQIKVFFSPESREFNDKWYTDLRCFRIDVFNSINTGAAPMQQAPMQQAPNYQDRNYTPPISQIAPREEMQFQEPQEDDDLPF